MRVEVINTGTELLLGHVINTNLRLLAEAIFPVGLRIDRQVTVPDGEAIRDALVESFQRAEIVLVSGGLGPTTDDITREITAELLGLELVHDEEIMARITERFLRRNLTVGERVARQAQRPREATVLANDQGTAPGLYFPPMTSAAAGPSGRTPHIFLLPGPPRELGPMMEHRVVPLLREIAPKSVNELRMWQIVGLGESHVEERVGEELLALGIELGYCARPGEVDLRAIGAPEQLAAAEAIIAAKLEPHISTRDSRPLEQVVVELLSSRSETVAVAESCTGGYIAHRLTNVPGASAVFMAGYVTYANEVKTSALGVAPELLERHGAVSHEVAVAMAEGALRQAGTTYALATTGIAGPGGAVPGKPVGTVYVALAETGHTTVVSRFCFPTDRLTFKDLVAQTALNHLRRRLNGTDAIDGAQQSCEAAAKLG